MNKTEISIYALLFMLTAQECIQETVITYLLLLVKDDFESNSFSLQLAIRTETDLIRNVVLDLLQMASTSLCSDHNDDQSTKNICSLLKLIEPILPNIYNLEGVHRNIIMLIASANKIIRETGLELLGQLIVQ